MDENIDDEDKDEEEEEDEAKYEARKAELPIMARNPMFPAIFLAELRGKK